ncbi:MAG: hypothetical protein M0Z91_05850 [Actinomycetota bacterium]|nr:hypothetical protein [Actinomycetota bacterium]
MNDIPSYREALHARLDTPAGREVLAKYLAAQPERAGWTEQEIHDEVDELAAYLAPGAF